MDRLARVEERVRTYLTDMGLDATAPAGRPQTFKYGASVLMISVFEAGDDAWVRVAGVVLSDLEPSLELLQRLLRLNTEVLVGGFLLFEDNSLAYSATMLGDPLPFRAFQQTLLYVARVADTYTEELHALGGGRRARDLIDAGAAPTDKVAPAQ
jgi:hypothetical protein